MDRKTYIFRWIVLLGAMCAALGGAYAEDYTYQSLTNLGPCASSRVLLMNNDTNDICPIEGQGYADTNETTTAVGGTFWWHDGELPPTGLPSFFVNLLTGANHVLYQKTDDAGGRKAYISVNGKVLYRCRMSYVTTLIENLKIYEDTSKDFTMTW